MSETICVRIDAPKGIWQADGDTNLDPNCAYNARNIRTRRGQLASAYGASRALPAIAQGEDAPPIRTLTRFTRRTRPDDPDVFIAAAGGALYSYTMGTQGWVLRAEGFKEDRWSYVTYEAAENGETVDVLIMSNEQDGMVAVYGSDLRVERKPLALGEGYGEVRFAVLGRYAERIWGTGAPGYPDSVFYSRAYDPFDWTGDADIPEDGGGVISQPTWDGDSFIALGTLGGMLIAGKREAFFEIRGHDPQTFTITRAYGTDGPVQAATLCSDGARMFYLTRGGVGVYDGSSLRLLARDALCEVMDRLAPSCMEQATACLCGDVYYLALGLYGEDGTPPAHNNAVIEYDARRGTFMLRTGVRVRDLYALGGEVYCTDAAAPCEVLRFDDPDAGGYAGAAMDCLWESGWLDLGKGKKKRDFTLRFTAEADADGVPLTLAVETQRRQKARTILLSRRRRDYRVKLQASGLRVRLSVRSACAQRWRIVGGIEMTCTAQEA